MIAPDSRSPSALHTPLTIRGETLRNRIMVSPMCMYSAVNHDGMASDFHLVHLGRFALGGAGIVTVEATAVEARGRISNWDLGLWSDEQIPPLERIARFIREAGAVPAIQLAHAGRKAATSQPWVGMGPLSAQDAARGDAPWPVVGPTGASAGPGWPEPTELSRADIGDVVAAFGDAARRAESAGFGIIELHAAHGYLIHSFLSPVSNNRTDEYGGNAENRARFALEVVDAVRANVSEAVGLFYRTSSVDGIPGGLEIDDTVEFARLLADRGVDVIDTSSGGVTADRSIDTRVRRGYAFHAPYSRKIKASTGMLTATVGLIVDAEQAETLLRDGWADIVALGREMLAEPNWAHNSRLELEGPLYDGWKPEIGWWLDKREGLFERLVAEGETPMSRFASSSDQPASAIEPASQIEPS